MRLVKERVGLELDSFHDRAPLSHHRRMKTIQQRRSLLVLLLI